MDIAGTLLFKERGNGLEEILTEYHEFNSILWSSLGVRFA